jgi:hypothetical protein
MAMNISTINLFSSCSPDRLLQLSLELLCKLVLKLNQSLLEDLTDSLNSLPDELHLIPIIVLSHQNMQGMAFLIDKVMQTVQVDGVLVLTLPMW